MITRDSILKKAGLGNMDTAEHKQAKAEIIAMRDMLATTVEHNRNLTRHVVNIAVREGPRRAELPALYPMKTQLVAKINTWGVEHSINIIQDNDLNEDYWTDVNTYRFASMEDATLFIMTFGGEYYDTLQTG
jgi:hypothetical protein